MNLDKLSEYPKVEIINQSIIILYEDGSKQTWTTKQQDPNKVTNETVDRLRAIKYLQRSIDNIIDACLVMLTEAGISKKTSDEYLNEAFRGLITHRQEKSEQTDESENKIILDSKKTSEPN